MNNNQMTSMGLGSFGDINKYYPLYQKDIDGNVRLALGENCDICKRERKSEDISRLSYSVSSNQVKKSVNKDLRYCNDRLSCFKGAKEQMMEEGGVENKYVENQYNGDLENDALEALRNAQRLGQYYSSTIGFGPAPTKGNPGAGGLSGPAGVHQGGGGGGGYGNILNGQSYTINQPGVGGSIIQQSIDKYGRILRSDIIQPGGMIA